MKSPRPTLLGLLSANALSLSAVYLLFAIGFETLRRFSSLRWAENASFAMEALPARALYWTGLLGPLRELYIVGKIDELTVRIIFGATSVLVIFGLALIVGLLLGAVRALRSR